jgi:hypothetical protein
MITAVSSAAATTPAACTRRSPQARPSPASPARPARQPTRPAPAPTAESARRSAPRTSETDAANHAPSPQEPPAAPRSADNPPAPATPAPRRLPPPHSDDVTGTHPATAHASPGTPSRDNDTTRWPQSPHPLARPHLPQPRTTPSLPTCPHHSAGNTKRPAVRSASTTARSSATMSMTTSKGVRRPLVSSQQGFGEGPRTTGSPASCRFRHPAADPITTLGDANPRRHHPPCRSTPWARTRIPTVSHPHPLMQRSWGFRDGGGRAVWGPVFAEKAGGEPPKVAIDPARRHMGVDSRRAELQPAASRSRRSQERNTPSPKHYLIWGLRRWATRR